MTFMELIGWVGSTLFALCAVPQAWQSWKDKHSRGFTWAFLLMWFFGEVLTIIYVAQKTDVLPLMVNYFLNIILLGIIIWFRVFPKDEEV